MWLHNGAEELGCGYRVKEIRIHVQLQLQSQGDQDSCASAVAEHLIFKTSTEEQTVDLTNKGMRKDSQIFSRWFHSVENNRTYVGL